MDENKFSPETNESEGKEPRKKQSSFKTEIYDWVQCIVVALVLCVIVFTFFFRTIDVVGHSMEPTLHEGDKLIVTNLFFTPEYGDIVIFRKEAYSEKTLVKRVIATEGQKVDIDFEAGVVYVDGVALDEPYTAEPTIRELDFEDEVTVPENCIFVMGDNRNRSNDSRDSLIGMVDVRDIIGHEIVRIFPFDKLGFVK